MAQNAQNLPEYDLARKRLKQRSQQVGQEQRQAIQREFARTGMLGSGAAVKTLQRGQQNVFEQERQGLEGIEAAESAEKRRLGEIQEGRDFASSEAEKQRKFASSEAEKQQLFASTEAEKARTFQRDLTNEDMLFRKEVFRQEVQDRLKQFEEQRSQFKQQFDLEKDIQEFNKQIARNELNQDTSLIGGLFGLQKSDNFVDKISNIATGGLFCHLIDTKVIMWDFSEKNIQDLVIGDRVLGGGKVTVIGQALVNDDVYEYKDEEATKEHIIFEEGVFKFIWNGNNSKLTNRCFQNVVYPINTENNFYITRGGYASMAFYEIGDFKDPIAFLESINNDEKYKSLVNGAILAYQENLKKEQPLYLDVYCEQDYEILKKWFCDHNWAIPPKDQIPSTSFLIYNGPQPIGFSSFYKTNSSIAVMGNTITDKKIPKDLRHKALKIIYDHVIDVMKEMGFKTLYYSTDRESLPVVYSLRSRGGIISNKGDGYILVMPLTKDSDNRSLLNEDFHQVIEGGKIWA